MLLGIDPKVDYAFKKLFGSEDVALLLISLLQAVVAPRRPITGVDFVSQNTEKSTPDDKQTIGDIKARDQGGRQFHLEMQWQVPRHFVKRALFYWSKFHPQQLREGENYQTLRPTVMICFLNRTLYQERKEHHLVFDLREKTHGLEFCDDLEIHLIELPKFTKTPEQLESALDRWCYFLRHGAELDVERLPPTLDVPEIRRAMEVLTVWTQDEIEREAYEQRLKFQRDQSSLLQDAEEIGHEKGAVAGEVRLLQELLKQPQTPLKDLTALSMQDLTALAGRLRQQLANGA